MHMRTIISIDIGGTQLRAAAYKQGQREPFAQKKVKTKASEPDTFGRLVKLVEDIWSQTEKVTAIGVSSPGPVDPHTGVIMFAPNIKEWRDFPIAAKLMQHFGVPTYLDNDANLAGLAEWKFGAGRGHHNVLYLTVSTGVGGGVIINDRLLQGYHGLAAELGHTVVQADGPLCGCGQRGHLESFSSGTGIERFVADQLKAGRASVLHPGKKNSAHDISEAAKQGDAVAKRIFTIVGEYIGVGLASVVNLLNPEIIIIGGGVADAGDILLNPIKETIRKRAMPIAASAVQIVPAKLGNNAGVIGASLLINS